MSLPPTKQDGQRLLTIDADNPSHKHGGHDDPICIVGMACRLPGAIRSPSDLWDFLIHKRSAQGKIPPNRFNIRGFYDQGHNRAGILNGDGGYFFPDDPREFDSSFFDINNLEAMYMDPQQRKLLEVVFECLENAGVPRESISGSNTGVYVANFTHDHYVSQLRDPDEIHRYHASGIGSNMLANRLSHVFGVHGPSMTLDTACSSSMYSLHIAMMALKTGECDGAIVAGTNIIMNPQMQISTAKAGILSSSSTCRTFDSLADGYGRADAVNSVYLKRMSSAIKDRHEIYAVIRGTAVNSNGKTPGITLPSADLQEEVIRKAYANANLDLTDTDYVECHGTGTAVGDPIELEALGRCFNSKSNQLMVGSVKTNLGHSEAASGLTSLIKVALALQRGYIPPSHGVKTLNPKLQLENRNIRVVTEVEKWPRSLRRASINSFGYGGANGHAILESIDSYLETTSGKESLPDRPKEYEVENSKIVVLPISAKSKQSLNARVSQISQLVKRCDPVALDQLAYTLACRRSHMEARCFSLVKPHKDGMVWLLESEPMVYSSLSDPTPLLFIFTGQGAQYAEMGKGLLKHQRFLASIRKLDEVLGALPSQWTPEWTLEETIMDSPEVSQINNAIQSQSVCTAIQIGLVDLLSSWGISAVGVIGHSSGEIAAAYAAGLHSASEAILVAYFRGYAVEKLQTKGVMIAIQMSEDDTNSLIESDAGTADSVNIACINSPCNTTLSGPPKNMDIICKELEHRHIFYRILHTGGRAYHSHAMKDAGELYEALVAPFLGDKNCETRRYKAKMYSSVWHKEEQPVILDQSTYMPRYWRDNLERPVQFNKAVSYAITSRRIHLVEIGPHPALKFPIQQIRSAAGLDAETLPYSHTLHRKEDAYECMMKLAGKLFLNHQELNWEILNLLPTQLPLSYIPPYPWDYSRGLPWFESRSSAEIRNRNYPRHELLGSQRDSGNDIDWSWRNILRLEEVAWIRGHKVESQVVFPAAGYLAMAIEAVCQILKLKCSDYKQLSFNFINVSINAALVVSDGSEIKDHTTEIHTTMSHRKLSSRSVSTDLFDFYISSWVSGRTVVHCTGSVRTVDSRPRGVVRVQDTAGYRNWSMDRWYSKCAEEGLIFGGDFQMLSALKTDSSRVRSDIICTTQPLDSASSTSYPVHPLIIDSCLQALMLSATHGSLAMLRPYLPTFIKECWIQPSMDPTSRTVSSAIHARSYETGFSTLRAACTLWNSNESPTIDIIDARLSMYVGKVTRSDTTSNLQEQRHPILRVRWKPDVLQLTSKAETAFDLYVDRSANVHDSISDDFAKITSTILDLVGHKNPRMCVLELGNDSIHNDKLSDLLDENTAFSRCRSWRSATFGEIDKFPNNDGAHSIYDVIVLRDPDSNVTWEKISEKLLPISRNPGVIITPKTSPCILGLRNAGFNVTVVKDKLVLATRLLRSSLGDRKVLIVARNASSMIDRFTLSLKRYLQNTIKAYQVEIVEFSELASVEMSRDTICISVIELEEELLASMTQSDMDLIRLITDTSTDVIWITGANMLGTQPDPNLTLSRGLGRTLMAEQPSLRFTIVDVGSYKGQPSKIVDVCERIGEVLLPSYALDDHEFIYKDGLMYASRFSPDSEANSLFRSRLGAAESFKNIQLAESLPAKLAIKNIGMADSIYFQQMCQPMSTLPAGFIDVAVKAVCLNTSSFGTLCGRNETLNGTSSGEFSGIVTAVGPDVDLRPGDRVTVNVPNHISTTERVPALSAHKLLPQENLAIMASIPATYCAALYAIRTRANLQPGETILINSGTDGFGLAAIALAQHLGAIVYTTVNSEAKREFMLREFGLPASQVFFQDNSFVNSVMEATNRKGIDVIVNSLSGELLHASWSCISDFGRFVEVGKRELLNAGRLEMDIFLRNATFTAFDPDHLFSQADPISQNVFARMTREVLEMYRSGRLKPMPVVTFDVKDTAQAYRFISSPNYIGQAVVSFENPTTTLPVAPPKFRTLLDPNKIYVLVGCLGGLGRSLSAWMLSRGARKFVFLGRSGCDKESSKELVERLKARGAFVSVIKGDVSCITDVQNAVAACKGVPIGGVVHAAMDLHEEIFGLMTNEAWKISVQPKWSGAWNLHKALKGNDEALDFFLTTSSITGSLGVATESNYCAANAFLDAFAYWRQTQGKPSISVGLGMISEIGYLHEHPHIESLLLRRGIQPINEDEFLQIIDIALSTEQRAVDIPASGHLGAGHMLTGMELFGVRELIHKGYDVTHTGMDDMRSSILSAALDAHRNHRQDGQAGQGDLSHLADNVPWLKGVPLGAIATLATQADAPSLEAAISRLVKKRFSSLILIPLDQIDSRKPFSSYGVDSMIAAEYRAWFWNAFKVEVPFLDLLSPQKSLDTISALIEAKMIEAVDA
ncbi:putative polyketide synthase [Annulohypoxylon nitens]|nr:putative polyketide synthase [Annulohypoxylon nitens]